MRFEFYHPGLDDVPKLSVDGTVENSVHFSHWQGNETPTELKADTSTEIALNLVASPKKAELTRGIELVTNNHFDTDGILSVWTVLTGERALELREKLVPAAEAGDFCEFKSEAGVKASIVIQGADQATPGDEPGSPIASYLARENVDDDARAYDLVLPEVERILTRIDDYEHLWRDPWEKIVRAMDSFARGTSKITEFADASLSFVNLGPDVFGANGFDPAQHAAPYTVISRHAKGRLFLIATPLKDGWAYRIDYPYYSWAETVVRPRIERRDFSALLGQLNRENPRGSWKLDNREMTSAIKFLDADGKLAPSSSPPDEVAGIIRAALLAQTPARVLHA